jgi:hypothetical protein
MAALMVITSNAGMTFVAHFFRLLLLLSKSLPSFWHRKLLHSAGAGSAVTFLSPCDVALSIQPSVFCTNLCNRLHEAAERLRKSG